MSEPPDPAGEPFARRRLAIAAGVLLALTAFAIAADVFAATELRCQRNTAGTRCTVVDTQLGVARGTLLIADVQGAYVEDQDYSRSEPRLVLQGKGDTPIASSAKWSSSQREEAAARVDAFASDAAQTTLAFSESHRGPRALIAAVLLALVGWLAWPQLGPIVTKRYQDLPVTPVAHEPAVPTARPIEPPPEPLTVQQRLVGVLGFQRQAYRALGDDPRMIWPALGILVFVSSAVGYLRPPGGLQAAGLECVIALVSWLAAGVVGSWFAAGRGRVPTLPLLRALGFAYLFRALSLYSPVLAWPVFLVAAYVAVRGVGSAGRLRSAFAVFVGQGIDLLLSGGLWLSAVLLGFE